MILSGKEIKHQLVMERITIDPPPVESAMVDGVRKWSPELGRINPASVDLTLGNEVAVYEDFTNCDTADEWERLHKANRPASQGFGKGPYDGRGMQCSPKGLLNRDSFLDTRKPAKLRKWFIDPVVGWVLMPGVGYLMHTVERIHTDHYVPVLDGKSSIGRLFIQVHVTAGFGDPGYDGQYTLEVTSKFPVIVYPGMRFCQMRFHAIEGEVLNYRDTGHYKGEQAKGAVASRINETGF